MKLPEIELPEWVIGKHIYIVVDNELFAYTEAIFTKENGKRVMKYSPLKIKTARCNGCGECCKDCVFIKNTGCGFGRQIPFSCLISDCSRHKTFPNCTERFE